jgi:uncharacterized protein (TIGR03435 family)
LERFDIIAKAAGPVPEARLKLMLQVLLEDRFKLKVHRETKVLPVVVLAVGKNGVRNLHPVDDPGDHPEITASGGVLTLTHATMATFAKYLGNNPPYGLRELVIDRTQLTGVFNITLSLKDFDSNDPAFAGNYEEMRSSMFGFLSAALEKQYGLKLERSKVPVDSIAVDAANKFPTENE